MRILFQSLAISFLFLGIGCQNQSVSPQEPLSAAVIQSKIVGTWSASTFEGRRGDVSATFRANGSAILTRSGITTQYAKWRAENGRIVLTQQSSLPPSSLDRWTIFEIDDHKLVFRRGDNSVEKKQTLKR